MIGLSKIIVMFAVFSPLVLPATISFSVSCGEAGSVTTIGPVSATCSGPEMPPAPQFLWPGGPDMSAKAVGSSTHVLADAIFHGPNSARTFIASASASSDLDYILTATGGNGTARFLPCIAFTVVGGISGSGDPNASAGASATFGPISLSDAGISYYSIRTCMDLPQRVSPVLLVYDVPQTFHLHLAGHARAENGSPSLFIGTEGFSEVAFTGGRLIDAEGNDVQGATFTLMEAVPEPCTGVLTGLAVSIMLLGMSRPGRVRTAP